MFGYSSYDNYFGTNNVSPYICAPGMMGGPAMGPMRMGKLPGINAPKEKEEHKELKQVAGLAAGIAAVILLFKGKGKVSNVIKKLFPKKAASETVDKITKPKFIDKIKELFVKKQKAATQATETVVSPAGDQLVRSAVEETGKPEAQASLLSVLKDIQSKVLDTPGVKPEDKVGDILARK